MSEQCETCRTEAIYFEEPCAECGFDPFGELSRFRAENERLTSMLAHHVSEPVPDGDPVRELGSFLCDALDDDQWAHVERMLNGFRAAIERKDAALRQRSQVQ